MRNANAASDIGEDRVGRVKQTCLRIRRALMLQVPPDAASSVWTAPRSNAGP